MSAIEISEPGPFTTVQDLGRGGHAHLGLARSGAFDRGSYRLANRLVGNEDGAAALEVLLGPFELVARGPLVVAVTGTRCEVTIHSHAGSTAEAPNRAVRIGPGERLRCWPPSAGLRTYVAVRGGLATRTVLASRSFDTMSRIGHPPLERGEVLELADQGVTRPWFDLVPHRRPGGRIVVEPGPRLDWLDAGAVERFVTSVWTVAGDSNRVGIRVAGPPLRRRSAELHTEATVPGAVQLPPDGQPIVLGPDCGVTGGYPVVAVVPQAGIDVLAQCRPGDQVSFHLGRLDAR